MRVSKCLSLSHITPARALHRVFIAPSLTQLPLSQKLKIQQQTRTAFTTTKPTPTKSRLPRDHEITSPLITLVSPDGGLLPPQSTHRILSRLDPKSETLCMVAAATDTSPPICKILSKSELYQAEKSKKKGGKNGKEPSKTVKGLEMNWAIEKGDLGHRLGRLREWLGRGWRVEVVLAKKRKGRVATQGESEKLVKEVRGVLGECGGREHKPAEGRVGGVLTIYCEGKVVKDKVEEKADEKADEEAEEEEEFADKAPRKGAELWGRSRRFEKVEKQEEGV